MKIVFLGDSVTEGSFGFYWDENGNLCGHTDKEACYVRQTELRLQAAFPGKEIECINAGVGGDNAAGALSRLQRDVLDRQPDAAVVCLGLNNAGQTALEAFTDPMREIFAGLRAHGVAPVLLTPNMLAARLDDHVPESFKAFTSARAEDQNNGVMDRFVQGAVDVAKEFGAPVCDAYAVWKRLASYGIDTTALLANYINHPTPGMHLLFVDVLMPTLTALCEMRFAEESPASLLT